MHFVDRVSDNSSSVAVSVACGVVTIHGRRDHAGAVVSIRRPCHHRELCGIRERSNVQLDNPQLPSGLGLQAFGEVQHSIC
jgi:hypothetical protein